jgi:hypothetical protein
MAFIRNIFLAIFMFWIVSCSQMVIVKDCKKISNELQRCVLVDKE